MISKICVSLCDNLSRLLAWFFFKVSFNPLLRTVYYRIILFIQVIKMNLLSYLLHITNILHNTNFAHLII